MEIRDEESFDADDGLVDRWIGDCFVGGNRCFRSFRGILAIQNRLVSDDAESPMAMAICLSR